MTGILNAIIGSLGGGGVTTFNMTAGTIGGGAGFCDGSSGTSTGVASGSISSATLAGGKFIAEVSYFGATVYQNRLRVRGFASDPTVNYLKSIVVNGITDTNTGPYVTYSYSSTYGMASWIYDVSSNSPVLGWSLVSGTQYNGNTLSHS